MPIFVDASDSPLILEQSSGVEPALQADYEPRALIAREPWTPLGKESYCGLGLQAGIAASHDSVSLLNIPRDLLALLREAHALAVAAEEILDDLVATIVHWIRTDTAWKLATSSAKGHGFNTGAPNRRSLTREASTGQLVGLHIDSWDGKPLRERRGCQNRLCINVGLGERALQFVPVEASDLAAWMEHTGARSSDAVAHFLRGRAEQPVVRMRLQPGQAYIAPTENLVHDACSLDEANDVTFTIRGQFVPNQSVWSE